jgi:hypothetical protein
MKEPKIQIKQKALIVILTVLFVILYGFLSISTNGVFSDRDRLSSAVNVDAVGERLAPLSYEINKFPNRVAKEILFLSKLSSLKRMVANLSLNTYEEVSADFIAFAEKGGIYHELQYIDENRKEKIRIEYSNESLSVVPKSSLEEVVTYSYVEDISLLSEGSVYISPVNLARRTLSAIQDIPIIYFGTPVVGGNGESKGMVVVAIRANYFFDDIRRSSRAGEQVYLIDQDGQYLAYPKSEKEYGTLLKTGDNFAQDYPEISKEVLSQFEKRRIESETSVFSLQHIFPATANFALSKGSQELLGANPDRDFFWVLVCVTDKDVLEGKAGIFESYEFFMIFSGLLIIIILGVQIFISEINRRRLGRK